MTYYSDLEKKKQAEKEKPFRPWKANAPRLAKWALEYLVVRTDAHGIYTPAPVTCKQPLTEWELTKHFRLEQTIGVHSTDPADDTCKWGVLDLDNHDGRKGSTHWSHIDGTILPKVQSLGILPLVECSTDGNFKLWFVWEKRIPAKLCRSFLSWLVKDYPCEVFPKQDTIKGRYGNYCRLPGIHHSRRTISSFYDSRHYFGADAVNYLLNFRPSNPANIPEEAQKFIAPRPERPPAKPGEGLLDWAEVGQRYHGDLRSLNWPGVFVAHDMLGDEVEPHCWEVTCPWAEEHSGGRLAYIWKAPDKYPSFYCHHAHCQGRNVLDALGWFHDSEIDEACEGYWTDRSIDTSKVEEFFKKVKYTSLDDVPIEEVTVKPKPTPKPEPLKPEPTEPTGDRTAYLWRGHHGNRHNVSDEDRRKRAASVLAAYDLLPPEGFLPDFMQCHLPTTDVSCRLLMGAALATAASILGRSVWVMNGGRRIYPCLWVALIAGSGERKSTAVNLLKWTLGMDSRLTRRLSGGDTTWAATAAHLGISVEQKDGEYDWDAARIQAAQSAGGDKGVMTLALDEIGGWIKKMDQTYNAGFKETLTGAYEGFEFLEKETAENAFLIPRPCINIIGASTPAWLAANTTENDVKGGFLGRWTFFISEGRDYTLPLCDTPDDCRVSAGLDALKNCHGELKLTQPAWDYYCEWLKGATCDERLDSWKSRLGNMVIKFSTIFALTERYEGPISEADVQRACRLVGLLLKDLGTYVEMELPDNREEADALRIFKIIKRGGPRLSHRVALKRSKMSSDRFGKAVKTLIERQDVQCIIEQRANNKGAKFYSVEGGELGG